MSRERFSFELPDRFIIGTVGQPGEREFFLQVRAAERVVSFAMEKGQAAALAARAFELLKEVGVASNSDPIDSAGLDTPVDSEFSIGAMTLTWSPASAKVLFEAQAMTNSDGTVLFEDLVTDEAENAPAILQVVLSLGQLRAFAKLTTQVVASGRQPCVFCGGPVDAGGHLCPRANGHRRSG